MHAETKRDGQPEQHPERKQTADEDQVAVDEEILGVPGRVAMSWPRNIQPTCAWPRPRSTPRHPGAWSRWGLCGSPGWSEKRWCFRWVATHSITGPSTAIEPSTASTARSVRPVLKLRWVNSR